MEKPIVSEFNSLLFTESDHYSEQDSFGSIIVHQHFKKIKTKQEQEEQKLTIEEQKAFNIQRCNPTTRQKTENALRSGQPVPDKNIWKQELIKERAVYLRFLNITNPVEHPRQLDWS